jgi:hypothetical protein
MRVYLAIAGLIWAGYCSGQSPLPDAMGSRLSGNDGSFSGLLFVASREVPLFLHHEGAGVLPVRTVVEAQPSEDAAWLRLWHEGRIYEADATAFRPEREILQDVARYEADVRKRYQDAAKAYDQKFNRLNELEKKPAVSHHRTANCWWFSLRRLRWPGRRAGRQTPNWWSWRRSRAPGGQP